jgi:hypothetical protein
MRWLKRQISDLKVLDSTSSRLHASLANEVLHSSWVAKLTALDGTEEESLQLKTLVVDIWCIIR